MSQKSNVCQLKISISSLYFKKSIYFIEFFSALSRKFFIYLLKFKFTFRNFCKFYIFCLIFFRIHWFYLTNLTKTTWPLLELQIIEYFLKRYVSKIQKNIKIIILCTLYLPILVYFTSFIHFRLSKKNPSLDVDDDSTIQFGTSEAEGIANFVA